MANRLLAVSFYLEARCWPVEFAFDHQQKIDTFLDEGCPIDAIPQRGGKPYLRDEFVLWYENRIGVAIIDDQQRSPLWRLRGFAKGFRRLVACLSDRLQLLIATGSESRHRLYCRLVHHPAVTKLSLPGFAITIELYQVRHATKFLQLVPRVNLGELTRSQLGTPQQRRRASQNTTAATIAAAIHKRVLGTRVTNGTVPFVTLVPSEAEPKFPGEAFQSHKRDKYKL
jgi:hypothetical protein